MSHIPATKFKAECLSLMDRVAERGERFVITKRGKPVAQLVPVPRKEKDSIFGCLRSRGSIRGDIVSPVLPPEVWNTADGSDALRTSEGPKEGESKERRRNRNR